MKTARLVRLIKHDLFMTFFAFGCLVAFIPIFTYFYFAKDLTTKERIMNKNDTGIMLLDRNERPFFTFYQAKNRTIVPLSRITKNVQDAVIASEDSEFYSHQGFSIRGIVRSVFINVTQRKIASGGSTITQQLVKNALLTSQRSILRKYQEIVLAQEIERRYSKKEILEMYFNSVYFGEGAFGIEQAAQTYFGKHAEDLDIAEASFLVGLLPSPSEFDPFTGGYTKAKMQQRKVLQKMFERGYITRAQKVQAEDKELSFSASKELVNTIGPHFAVMVRDELIKKYGEEKIIRSGFKVKTTLDLDWQTYAEKVVADQVALLAPNKVTNGAATVIDPQTGQVKVLVGSKDWHNDAFGKLNIATTTRQPGSSFKPIVYAAAFEKGLITPATILRDEQTTFAGNYRPLDYDRKFRGSVTVRRSLANSLNIPSVAILERLGVSNAILAAQQFGITTIENDLSLYGLSLVLGTGEVKLLELTNAYATFANKGKKNDITTVLEIKDKTNKIIYRHHPNSQQVISEATAFLISSILSDSAARAEVFGNTLNTSLPAAVKTGTTENYKDAWTIGYTPSLAVGVWVGNNDGAPMDNVAGSLGAAPIWRELIETFSKGITVESFTPPVGVTQMSICIPSGEKDRVPFAMVEYFVEGTQPQAPCIPTRTPTQSPIQVQRQAVQSQEAITLTPIPQQKPHENNSDKEQKEKKND